MLTTAALTTAQINAFAQVSITRTVTVAATFNTTNCSSNSDIAQAIADMKSALTPMLVVDV